MAKKTSNRVKPAETELKEKLVNLNRVAKVTKGGRTFSFAAIVVVGDGKGTVGHGLGKARDVSEAISKAVDDAKKSLIRIPLHKGTIPHEQKGKYGAGRVLIGVAVLELNVAVILQFVAPDEHAAAQHRGSGHRPCWRTAGADPGPADSR